MQKIRQKDGFVAYRIKHYPIRGWYWIVEVYDNRGDDEKLVTKFEAMPGNEKEMSQKAKRIVRELARKAKEEVNKR